MIEGWSFVMSFSFEQKSGDRWAGQRKNLLKTVSRFAGSSVVKAAYSRSSGDRRFKVWTDHPFAGGTFAHGTSTRAPYDDDDWPKSQSLAREPQKKVASRGRGLFPPGIWNYRHERYDFRWGLGFVSPGEHQKC